MFNALRAAFQQNQWEKASVEQRVTYFAVGFGTVVMLDAVLFLMIVHVSKIPILIGAVLSVSFLILLLSIVLDWFWDWTKDEVAEG